MKSALNTKTLQENDTRVMSSNICSKIKKLGLLHIDFMYVRTYLHMMDKISYGRISDWPE